MAELPSRQFPALIVGIGASAGGLAAFKKFLASTPADTGMAFVLVQHLDPHHKSLLVELLGAHSPIPVVAAKDGLAVKENCVFVIPPNATLTIKDGVLRLTAPAPAREHRRPIDTFFASLAPNSQGIQRIGAPNQRKLFCDNDFARDGEEPRWRQSVGRIRSTSELLKAAQLWAPSMVV